MAPGSRRPYGRVWILSPILRDLISIILALTCLHHRVYHKPTNLCLESARSTPLAIGVRERNSFSKLDWLSCLLSIRGRIDRQDSITYRPTLIDSASGGNWTLVLRLCQRGKKGGTIAVVGPCFAKKHRGGITSDGHNNWQKHLLYTPASHAGLCLQVRHKSLVHHYPDVCTEVLCNQ